MTKLIYLFTQIFHLRFLINVFNKCNFDLNFQQIFKTLNTELFFHKIFYHWYLSSFASTKQRVFFSMLKCKFICDIMKIKVNQIFVIYLSVSKNIQASSSTSFNMNIYSSIFFDRWAKYKSGITNVHTYLHTLIYCML